MEASSPAFIAHSRISAYPALDVSRTGRPNTPSLSEVAARSLRAPFPLPLRFIVTGLFSLLLGAGWLLLRRIRLAGYHYSPEEKTT